MLHGFLREREEGKKNDNTAKQKIAAEKMSEMK